MKLFVLLIFNYLIESRRLSRRENRKRSKCPSNKCWINDNGTCILDSQGVSHEIFTKISIFTKLSVFVFRKFQFMTIFNFLTRSSMFTKNSIFPEFFFELQLKSNFLYPMLFFLIFRSHGKFWNLFWNKFQLKYIR